MFTFSKDIINVYRIHLFFLFSIQRTPPQERHCSKIYIFCSSVRIRRKNEILWLSLWIEELVISMPLSFFEVKTMPFEPLHSHYIVALAAACIKTSIWPSFSTRSREGSTWTKSRSFVLTFICKPPVMLLVHQLSPFRKVRVHLH